MKRGHENQRLWLCSVLMLVLTTVIWMAEHHGYLTGIRLALHNMADPGRLALLRLAPLSPPESRQSATLRSEETAELQNALLQNELQRRQLLIENARLHNELQALQRLEPVREVAGRSLMEFVALQTQVLSHSGLPDKLREMIINAGESRGLQVSQLVIQGGGMIVDHGTDHGLAEGQKVTQGTAVVGRIAATSQWVGQVQPVTDEGFSAAVQIARLEAHGAAFGAKGLLEGTGDTLCRITGIPYTESVSVGDEVFSADLDDLRSPRLYYGRIVHAEFSAGGQWEIHVEPAFQPDQLTEVSVVMQRLNPGRLDTGATPLRRRSRSH